MSPRVGTSADFLNFEERKLDDSVVRRLLDAAPDAIVVVDEQGRIVLANQQTQPLFGYAKGELLGQAVELLIPERLRAGHEAHRARFASAPKVRAMGSGLDLWGRRKDGSEFPIEISLSPLPTEQGMLTSASIRDVSDRVAREEELRAARAVAESANSAKSEFLASMSHELRTPLNAILGFSQLLQRDKTLSGRHQERIAHVLRAGDHLLALIDEVLDLSRIEAGQITVSPEPVSVLEVLREIQVALEPAAGQASISIVVDPLPSDTAAVTADRTRFKQILLNFGSNSIKYGKPNGSVRFKVSEQEGFVRVTVADDGIGIPTDKQDKVFQPFQRAGQETGTIEGTGIGLTISKRLAELMGGTVGFISTQGVGSEFWIELQARRASSSPPRARSAVLGEQSVLISEGTTRYRVVYVEDNPSGVALMEELIADFTQVDLLVAPTAELGIELIRTHQPHAVIMDIHLPGMNGIEAMHLLRASPETAHIPVIALSAAAMVRDKTKVSAAGFHRYLTKPVDVDELTHLLEEILSRSNQEQR
jgi:PAS domain S-box-containing protein